MRTQHHTKNVVTLRRWEGVDCSNIGTKQHSNNVTEITCLTNPWDYSGEAKDAVVLVSVMPYGNARVEEGLSWSYVDLWSETTTWGGEVENIPRAGDSVTITEGQYIVMDTSPPPLFLLIIYGGVLEFSQDVGDLALNASYIFVFGGKFVRFPKYSSTRIGLLDRLLDLKTSRSRIKP